MVVFSLLHVNIWNIHVLTPFLEPPYFKANKIQWKTNKSRGALERGSKHKYSKY